MRQIPPEETPSPLKVDSSTHSTATAFVCVAIAAIVFAVGMHIWRMAGIAFTSGDDLNMGIVADKMLSGSWWPPYYSLAHHYAVLQGRAYFYFSMIFFVLPFFTHSMLMRAVVAALLQLGAVGAIAVVLGQYAGWRNALLFTALTCACLPYWLQVSPVVGYPFFYHLPVLLFFAGLGATIRLARRQGSSWGRWIGAALAWAAILISLFFYEALIPPFFLVAVATAAAEARRARNEWNWSAAARAWAPWLAIFGVWSAIYLGYRRMHPSVYGGSALAGIGGGQLGSAARALFYFESYSLPGANCVGLRRYTPVLNMPEFPGDPLSFFLHNLTVDGVILAVLVIVLAALRVAQFTPRLRGGRGAAALALVCALLTPLPLAFTSKYRSIQEVQRDAPYLPGYFSFLAWCVVLALVFPLAASALHRLPALRRSALVVLTAFCAAATAGSEMFNDAVSTYYSQSADKWKTVDLLARSDWFAALPANSVFFAPGLWDGIPTNWQDDIYWDLYFSRWAGRPMRVIRLPGELPKLLSRHAPLFYCEHQWLAGRLNSVLAVEPIIALSTAGEAVGDSVLLFSQEQPEHAVLEYRAVGVAEPLRASKLDWRRQSGAYTVHLSLPNLIVGTARMVDRDAASSRGGPILEFQRGFAAVTERGGDGHYWRWSDGEDGEGEINLFNLSAQPMAVRFRATLRFNPQKRSAVFDFTSPQRAESLTVDQGGTVEQIWRLAPGANRVRIQCHAGRMPTPGDTRYIVFGLWDWTLAAAENP